MTIKTLFVTAISFICGVGVSSAQDTVGRGAKEVSFTVSEGTWMSLDVSPDGKTIIFDLLNDLYTMPSEGGVATVIHNGPAIQRSPQFSPNGEYILYLSDESGTDNAWISRPDGGDARQITKSEGVVITGPTWAPDGNSIAAVVTHPEAPRVYGSEIRRFSLDGDVDELIIAPPTSRKDVQEPRFSPDGRYLYYSERIGGDHYVFMNTGLKNFAIMRHDLEPERPSMTGDESSVFKHKSPSWKRPYITGFGGASTAQVSPDGKQVAFVRRLGARTVLFASDVETKTQRPLYAGLSRDLQGDYLPQEHYYPAYDWFPDNRHIAIWAKGKLLKVDTETGKADVIPFEATSQHTLQPAVRFKQDLAPETVTVRTLRGLTVSPDAGAAVFRAVGKLWTKGLHERGVAQRLTDSQNGEFDAAWSPDGQHLAFVSWHDETGSELLSKHIATGRTQLLARSPGVIREPVFSPDGTRLAYRIMAPDFSMSAPGPEPGVYVLNLSDEMAAWLGQATEVLRFSPDGERVYFRTEANAAGKLDTLRSIRIDGKDEREHAFTQSYDVLDISISPDLKWLAFKEYNFLHLVPFDDMADAVKVTSDDNGAVRRVSELGGYDMTWSADSSKLMWTLGPGLYGVDVPSNEKGARLYDLGFSLPADRPEGVVAFIGGRVIPIEGKVIENGVVLVEGNRIKAVGPQRRIKIPKGAAVIDISGKTIMPGLFDAHGHIDCCYGVGVMPVKQPTRYAALAYGVTTNFDPYSNDLLSYESAEMTLAGELVGPRWLSSAHVVHGVKGRWGGVYHPIKSKEDAKTILRRRTEQGPSIIKSYKMPTRSERQWLLEAAREAGFMVDAEGAGQFFANISMVIDGHTNLEHNLPVDTYYQDLQNLFAASDVSITPTLIVVFGELFGENFIYQTEDLKDEVKIRSFVPDVNNSYNPIMGEAGAPMHVRCMHTINVSDELYDIGFRSVGRTMTDLEKRGVIVNVGSHGQVAGLAMHWEMILLAEGGMAPEAILRGATINGAKTYGLDHQLGSIEPGKLADLIVLDKNPLEDIRNTNSVRYTMMNGRLYDAYTMNEIGNYDVPRGKFYWELLETHGIDWNPAWAGE
ncbi:MAG: amidohydrolase family protein [Pseudomonadota bacterium]